MLSLSCLGMAHGGDAGILLCYVVVDFLVIKTAEGRSDIVLLAHFKILSEVLVAAPPIRVDHAEALVSANLVDVRVTNIVLFPVSGMATIFCGELMLVVSLT